MNEPGAPTRKPLPVAERLEVLGNRLLLDPRFILVPFAIVAALVALQYARWGFATFLGWDSSYYVYFTVLIDQYGLGPMIHTWSYPQLYVILLWIFGRLVGSADLAERVLPFVWLAVLLVAYDRITHGLTRDRRLTNLALLLTPLTLSTIVVFSTLNRTLMSFSLALLALVLIARLGPRLFRPRAGNAVLFAILLAVAATELETYLVLGLAVVLSFAFRRDLREFLESVLFLAIPVLLVLPLSLAFVVGYVPAQAFASGALALDANTALIYAAGSAFASPFLALGLWRGWKRARAGDRLGSLVMGWMLALGLLFVVLITGLVGLPPLRVLYILPAPPFLALGIPEAEALWQRLARTRLRRAGA